MSSTLMAAPKKTPTIPYQFQAVWCSPGEAFTTYVDCERVKDNNLYDPNLRVTSTGYRSPAFNWWCTFTSVKYNAARQVVHIDAMCQHGYSKWKERGTLEVNNSNLNYAIFEIRNDPLPKD